MQPYVPSKEDVEVVGADEQTEFNGENLSMPDSISISVEYGAKGYRFTFDILSDHFHTKVTASPLKCYKKGDVIEDEYFIDFDSFTERFKRLRFLESVRWEKSINKTLTGKETTAHIRYAWNDNDSRFARTEKSFGDGPLIKTLETLLANEDVLHRVIHIVKDNIGISK